MGSWWREPQVQVPTVSGWGSLKRGRAEIRGGLSERG